MAGDGSSIREMSFVRKTADETVNNDATPNNDSELILPIAANETVMVKIIYYWVADIAGGFNASINGPAAAVNISWAGLIIRNTGTPIDAYNGSSYNTTTLAILDTVGFAQINALIENGANAGNIYASWCQHTSNANNTTVERGSFMQMLSVA